MSAGKSRACISNWTEIERLNALNWDYGRHPAVRYLENRIAAWFPPWKGRSQSGPPSAARWLAGKSRQLRVESTLVGGPRFAAGGIGREVRVFVQHSRYFQPERPGIRIARQQAGMALRDMEYDRPRLEQGKTVFFVGRNLPERMKRSMGRLLHRSERDETNLVRLARLFERPANACRAPVPCRDRATVQRR